MIDVLLMNYYCQIVNSNDISTIQNQKLRRVIYIETERLLLRDWNPSDLEPFINLGQDPQVMEHFPALLTKEESTDIYQRMIAHFQEWGYGLFAAELKETEEFIGFIGLSHPRFKSDFTPCVEIGWRLMSHVWQRGLASEGANAVLEYAFTKLKLNEIYSFTAINNIASYRVMEKIGMKKVSTFVHPNLPIDHALSEHWIYHIKSTSII